jgi:protein-disulfide isomerase
MENPMKALFGTCLVAAFVLGTEVIFADDDWLKDEVLKQLSELRQDNKVLHGEVDALKKRLAEPDSIGRKGQETLRTPKDLLGGKIPLGKPSAKIIVAEFTDYQCPFCRKFAQTTFPRVRKDYVDTGKVQYVVRDYPLGFHAAAKSTAVAANCAGRQKAYWDMKARLFEHQAELGRGLYLRHAGELKLDRSGFEKCLDDARMAEAIDRDVAFGNTVGIQATPTFLLGQIEGGYVKNLKAVSGAMAFEAFADLLDSMMKPR